MGQPAEVAEALAPSRGPSPVVPLWRKLFPFAVAAALVLFVATRLDFTLFVRQLARTNYVGFLGFSLAFTVALLAADAFATVGIYRRTICPISFREFFVVRAASYLPSLLNHHVGQAWLTYFISKAYRAPLWRVAGATLLTYATTLGCLLLFGILALPFNHARIPWLAPVVVPAAVLALSYLGVVAAAPRALRSWQTTAPLMETGVRGHLAAFAYRLPHMGVLFLGTWLPFWFFEVPIPFVHALATIPPLMLVAALPITPQGVGTRDLLAIQLFSEYAAGAADERRAAIVAATLSWACALTIIQALISPLFMKKARQLLKGAIERAQAARPATARSSDGQLRGGLNP